MYMPDVLEGTYEDQAYTYVGENTNYVPGDEDNLCTKIILKAQLVQKVDETTYKPVEIARWFATEYAGKENLLIAVANTIKYNYFKKIGEDYVYIAPEDLMTVKGDGVKVPLTHVYFQLDNTKSLDWHIKDNNGTPTSVTAEWVNTELAKLEPALLYEDGQTFYFVDVKHLPVSNTTVDKGEYGIVRNHIYNVKINSIGGYGSPIYIGDSYLKDPEYPIVPEDEGSFVSAQVKILSWRLVDQLVDIQN